MNRYDKHLIFADCCEKGIIQKCIFYNLPINTIVNMDLQLSKKLILDFIVGKN